MRVSGMLAEHGCEMLEPYAAGISEKVMSRNSLRRTGSLQLELSHACFLSFKVSFKHQCAPHIDTFPSKSFAFRCILHAAFDISTGPISVTNSQPQSSMTLKTNVEVPIAGRVAHCNLDIPLEILSVVADTSSRASIEESVINFTSRVTAEALKQTV